MTIISATEFKRFCRCAKPLREAKNWYGENMRDRQDPSSLDAAVARYLVCEAFTMLAPATQRMRRNLLKNICAEVRRLSAAEISEARNEIPSETPARSVPWRPVHRRRNWITA